MTECCSNKQTIIDCLKTLGELCNCKITETEKGIQMDIEPKDASKVEEFKAVIKSSSESCGCSCNCS